MANMETQNYEEANYVAQGGACSDSLRHAAGWRLSSSIFYLEAPGRLHRGPAYAAPPAARTYSDLHVFHTALRRRRNYHMPATALHCRPAIGNAP
jgi:hypothetical protein